MTAVVVLAPEMAVAHCEKSFRSSPASGIGGCRSISPASAKIGRPQTPAIRSHNRTPTVHRDNRVDSCAAPENERRAADPVFRTFSFASQAGAMPTPVALTAAVVL